MPVNHILNPGESVFIFGTIVDIEEIGKQNHKRLVVTLKDSTKSIELIWFQGVEWILKKIKINNQYLVFGKTNLFKNILTISHPEIEEVHDINAIQLHLVPLYSSTDKLSQNGFNGRQLGKLTEQIFNGISENDLPEIIPLSIVNKYKLMSRFLAYKNIHFPKFDVDLQQAKRRFIFEDFFIEQVHLSAQRAYRKKCEPGPHFSKVGNLFNKFYKDYLPFELTNAQKKVIKEIRQDTCKGFQMNRLLQGDVGSGKTIVAILTILLAIDNGFQACFLAPTDILATQHFESLKIALKHLPVQCALLKGSTPAKQKKQTIHLLKEGVLNVVVGTHAILEATVEFKNIGLAIIDEQHKFGVEQRSKLYQKSALPSHVLCMTATPIPRTLAMTMYGDLDISIINELPPGRKDIKTVHLYDSKRNEQVYPFLKSEIAQGRQIFIVYPIIEESEKLDYENLYSGYEYLKTFFMEPYYKIAIVHGKMDTKQKDMNMQNFINGQAHILVSTTVIEVGVNIPNASVMLIESAQKFGLSQLHQLRGRVGRGADKSYCILLTPSVLNEKSLARMIIMAKTNNGFEIAEKDLELRGPGDISGTKQSGALDFKLADLVKDKNILEIAKKDAEELIAHDPQLQLPENLQLQQYLNLKKPKGWEHIG